MRNARFFLAGTAVAAVLALAGCGSNLDSGGDITVGVGGYGQDTSGRAFVGANLCIQCHATFSWSAQEVKDYLEGKHVIHSSHVTASEPECLPCHDPVGDGRTVEQFIDPADVPDEGLAAVTCEACHGAGGEHFGAGPIPLPIPGPEACGSCHSTLPDSHLGHHPEANNIVEKYLDSAHGTAGNLHNSARCAKCHNHEGAMLYKDVTTAAQLEFTVLPVPVASNVQCKTCHNPHNAGALLKSASSSDSAEYRTCTNCHQSHDADLLADGVVVVNGVTPNTGTTDGSLVTDTNATVLLYHAKRYSRIIADSHYDDPATADLIEGYAMDTADEHVCRDCHDVHAADITINEEWAESGHAGMILQEKEAAAEGATDRTLAQTQAIRAAGVETSWNNRDWTEEPDCQRCHTATGAKNMLDDPTAYYEAMDAFLNGTGANPNDFSYLEAGQAELLYCWACHSDNSGALRNAGKTLPLEDRNFRIFATIPDIGKSGVCMACHGGRGDTKTIKDSDRSSRFQGHHAPTGGSVFNEITHTGYEFTLNGTSLNYANPEYRHDEVGLNGDTPESGDGPCASCHMSGADHTFEALAHVAGTTTIKAQALCDTCHTTGTIGTIAPADLIPLKAGQTEAVDLLGLYINNGASFTNAEGVVVPADPAIENYLNAAFNQNVTDLDAYGAFQNWKYMDGEDPCAYLHNSKYAKRLIFDSIDWIDSSDPVHLDGTIFIDPDAYPDAAAWMGADVDGNVARP